MDSGKHLELLYQYAVNHQFDEFDESFSELKATLSFELFWEAYLIRAQIKLFIADPSVVDDLDIAKHPDVQPHFACLNTIWEADAPNRFIVYSKEPGSLRRFMRSLPQVRDKMARWYGEAGEIMVRQMQINLLYCTGDIQESLALTNESLITGMGTHTDAFLLSCARFRCDLAMGKTDEAEQCMMDIIRMSKKYPECVAPYLAFRGWANITTSWNGDTPRFTEGHSGRQQPVLDDRLDDIRQGSARITPLETPFARYAQRHYKEAYTLRQYYMDVFHAMYWLYVGDHSQLEACIQRTYDIAIATGIVMPIVECGEQIMPLLRHMRHSGMDIADAWLSKISAMAQQYEKALERYRATNA